MVEEVVQMISDMQASCNTDEKLPEENKLKIGMYLDIVRETLTSQHKIIYSYESITKKLESQIGEC